MTGAELLANLRRRKIQTWFDLGLFLDELRDQRKNPMAHATGSFRDFLRSHRRMAFVTFYYGTDGVTIEVEKYAQALREIEPQAEIHYIAGNLRGEVGRYVSPAVSLHQAAQFRGFDQWPLYRQMYFTPLSRGSSAYNQLIKDLWRETLAATARLVALIEKNEIRLLIPVNLCSNPGNVSAALAVTLVSELMCIPVIANAHDYFWEGGSTPVARAAGTPAGPRDFFFTNYNVGEVFSLLENLFPWESPSWLYLNINRDQSDALIGRKGFLPGLVTEIATAVDFPTTHRQSAERRIATLVRLEKIFAHGGSLPPAQDALVYARSLRREPVPTTPVLLGLHSQPRVRLSSDNILLLQPTRIVERKRIEIDLQLLAQLFADQSFVAYFRQNPQLTLTLLVAGPVHSLEAGYLPRLVAQFAGLKKTMPRDMHRRVFFGLLYGALRVPEKKSLASQDIHLYDVYQAASLILLPSLLETRGLPIIEAAALGAPILVHRYRPESVYGAVIGENLSANERLRVVEFSGDQLSLRLVAEVAAHIIHPTRFANDLLHNRRVISRRYSMDALRKDWERVLRLLYEQLHGPLQPTALTRRTLRKTVSRHTKAQPALAPLLAGHHRQRLQGFGKLGYMSYLKSLIDPSFFRVEEQEMRALIFSHALFIVRMQRMAQHLSEGKIQAFYRAVYGLFLVREGRLPAIADHALAYRHRDDDRILYREVTFHELTSSLHVLAREILQAKKPRLLAHPRAHTILAFRQMVLGILDVDDLAIDWSARLEQQLHSALPYAVFLDKNPSAALDTLVVQPLRERLQVSARVTLRKAVARRKKRAETAAYIFVPQKYAGEQATMESLQRYLRDPENSELAELVDSGYVQVVPTDQRSVGCNLAELGSPALRVLDSIRRQGGFIVTCGEDAAMMTDILGMDVYHLGLAWRTLTTQIMGLRPGQGFVEWVPAGVRPTIAYPTPLQTSLTLYETLRGSLFQRAVKSFGEKVVLRKIRADAEQYGDTVKAALERMLQPKAVAGDDVQAQTISGRYKDGEPYYGVLVRLRRRSIRAWHFNIINRRAKPAPAATFLRAFQAEYLGRQARVAWNGGYILNAELSGKLGLSADYIGTPLGLVIENGRVVAPPLFHKPALLITSQGRISLQRVAPNKGFKLVNRLHPEKQIQFSSDCYNRVPKSDRPYYYDLSYAPQTIPGDGRTIVRLAGDVVRDIVPTKAGQQVPVIPVGLTLSFAPGALPEWLQKNQAVTLVFPEFGGYEYGVEAGPLLLYGGRRALQMRQEGWTSQNSIRTQAARVDSETLRGPKIAVGLDAKRDLYLLAINGRIRESVGATHDDMVRVLQHHGIRDAMGFDPGGSVTLVVDGRLLNIPPYNSAYEKNIYTLPPEGRPIANMIIAWQFLEGKYRVKK